MITNWIYTVPGSLIIAALLAWPMSAQDSQSLFERIRFCLSTMLGFAVVVWGSRQQPNDFHENMGFQTVVGLMIAMMAAAFLIWLWFDKVTGMMADILLGCTDSPDDSPCDPKYEAGQIEEAVQLFRRGKRRRALRLCNRIIESHSQHTPAAATLAFWIENPGTMRFFRPPRTALACRGRSSRWNCLWIF